ncbi:MAG TPA: hypothetical protein DF383_12315 [Deltaproteobacteria bacterium]|nr:hypothetical protein [Deltaproteobacteria bacterium]
MKLRELIGEADLLLQRHPEWLPRLPRNPLKVFETGGVWTRLVLGELRGEKTPTAGAAWTRLGFLKYSFAGLAGLAWLAACLVLRSPWPALLAVPAFYLVEVQMLFLFPVAADGSPAPFRESRIWTRRAGGTCRVLPTVFGIAWMMTCGGLIRGKCTRYWTLGCLAVLLWYERLRVKESYAL